MAVTLLAQYAAAVGDVNFIAKVEMAMEATAINLVGEAPAFADHANRMALMKAASNNPAQYAPLFALAIASQGIDSTSTDAAIQTACANVWNDIAGQV